MTICHFRFKTATADQDSTNQEPSDFLITPPPIGGRGIVFDRFLCFLFISLSARLQENRRTDLHEIFRERVM